MRDLIKGFILALVFFIPSLAMSQEVTGMLPKEDLKVLTKEVPAENLDKESRAWTIIDGSNIFVYYLPGANLRTLEARLRTRYIPFSVQYKTLLADPAYSLESRVLARLHIIFERVSTILGMDPVVSRLNVKIFHSRNDLADEVLKIIGVRKNYKSFYIHEFSGVYTSEQDFLDSLIAHEFAHAIIDHYFKVVPPSQVAELLATYVDEHLEKD